MRMLLVEDEKKVSDLVARALRAERYAVDVAADGERGWELAQAYEGHRLRPGGCALSGR
jgi:DNA-binding response OmpR family regulator